MNLIWAIKSKTSLKVALPTAVFLAISSLIIGLTGRWQVALSTLSIGFAVVLILLALIEIRRKLNSLERLLATQRELVTGQSVSVDKLEERARKDSQTLQNIAGSVGRAAPLIRDISTRNARIEVQLANTAGSAGRTAPLVREIFAQTNRIERQLGIASLAETVTLEPNLSVQQPASEIPSPKATEPAYEFPPVPFTAPNKSSLNVAIIADEFTAKAFSYEWNIHLVTPTNWESIIDLQKPDFVFCESAWEANGGSWRYHLVGSSAPRPPIVDLTEYCRTQGIPTIFWNKEDPPHFEDFLPTAALFDWVFTTDSDLLPEYRKRLNHDRVGVLPFAAQPKLHNPARIGRLDRTRDVVFGGMYFRDKYPERAEQMDIILPAAAEFGLDIYSRQADGKPEYQFPEPLQKYVRGSLPYEQMITAYHSYKAVVNVNSVVGSPTMCARRIFEATACGAAVVTMGTPAIETFFPNRMLTVVSDREDAYHEIRASLRSDELRDRKVHVAQRHIWENHTYAHRAEQVENTIGIPNMRSAPSSSFVVSTNRPDNVKIVLQNFARQRTLGEKELVLLTHGFKLAPGEIAEIKELHGIDAIELISAPAEDSLGKNLNNLARAASGDLLFRMDDDDYYGDNYARDLSHAIQFSGSQVVGKAESYIYFESLDTSALTYIGHSHRYTDFVRGATICGPRETFLNYTYPEQNNSEDSSFLGAVKADGGTIYSADRFNFLVMRRNNKGTHTWQVSDAKLFGSGEARFFGNDVKQVDA